MELLQFLQWAKITAYVSSPIDFNKAVPAYTSYVFGRPNGARQFRFGWCHGALHACYAISATALIRKMGLAIVISPFVHLIWQIAADNSQYLKEGVKNILQSTQL